MSGELLRILRPLPAVPVRAEEKLLTTCVDIVDVHNMANFSGKEERADKAATHRESTLGPTLAIRPPARVACTHRLAQNYFTATAGVFPPRCPRSQTRRCPPTYRPCIQHQSGHLELSTRPGATSTPAEQTSVCWASWKT